MPNTRAQSRSHRTAARPSPAARAPHRRAAAQRLRIERSFIERYRGRILALFGGGVFAALLAIVILMSTNSSSSGTSASAAPASLVESVTQLPATTFDAVGTGSATNAPTSIGAPALTADGKPELLYVGGEFCPFCAAERWAMVVALSRFGSFDGLQTTQSSSADVYPSTPTFSFRGSSYTSDYLSFVPVEHFSNTRTSSGYAELQPLTDAQQQTLNQYDAGGSIPFLDFGGKYVLSGATYNPGVLSGRDWDQIAAKLADPTSAQAQAIIGSANLLTATICKLTDGNPGAVCQAPGTMAAAAALKP